MHFYGELGGRGPFGSPLQPSTLPHKNPSGPRFVGALQMIFTHCSWVSKFPPFHERPPFFLWRNFYTGLKPHLGTSKPDIHLPDGAVCKRPKAEVERKATSFLLGAKGLIQQAKVTTCPKVLFTRGGAKTQVASFCGFFPSFFAFFFFEACRKKFSDSKFQSRFFFQFFVRGAKKRFPGLGKISLSHETFQFQFLAQKIYFSQRDSLQIKRDIEGHFAWSFACCCFLQEAQTNSHLTGVFIELAGLLRLFAGFFLRLFACFFVSRFSRGLGAIFAPPPCLHNPPQMKTFLTNSDSKKATNVNKFQQMAQMSRNVWQMSNMSDTCQLKNVKGENVRNLPMLSRGVLRESTGCTFRTALGKGPILDQNVDKSGGNVDFARHGMCVCDDGETVLLLKCWTKNQQCFFYRNWFFSLGHSWAVCNDQGVFSRVFVGSAFEPRVTCPPPDWAHQALGPVQW